MKIVKIRDGLMFNSNNPGNWHYYALFYNRRYRKYNAIRLTHIAIKDSRRYQRANNGLILPIRLKQIDKYADSGITRERYINDINGNNLNANIGQVVIPKVSGYSSQKIKNYGNRCYSTGSRIR